MCRLPSILWRGIAKRCIQVLGQERAESRTFSTFAEAQQWLSSQPPSVKPSTTSRLAATQEIPPPTSLSGIGDILGADAKRKLSPLPRQDSSGMVFVHCDDTIVGNAGTTPLEAGEEVLDEVTTESTVLSPPSFQRTQTEGIKLSKEQLAVFDRVKKGENIFFTGSAGTGKSVLLREIIAWCRAQYTPERVAVTASTGIAGVNIGGSTLHSWAKIQLGKAAADTIVGNLKRTDEQFCDKAERECGIRRRVRSDIAQTVVDEVFHIHRSHFSNAYYRWETCAVLIIDESELNCVAWKGGWAHK